MMVTVLLRTTPTLTIRLVVVSRMYLVRFVCLCVCVSTTDNNLSLDSDDDFRSGCRNVSHHYRQQSFSGLQWPGRSNYTSTCYPWVQTIYCIYWLTCQIANVQLVLIRFVRNSKPLIFSVNDVFRIIPEIHSKRVAFLLLSQPVDLIQSKPKFTSEETSKTMFVVRPTAVEIDGTI